MFKNSRNVPLIRLRFPRQGIDDTQVSRVKQDLVCDLAHLDGMLLGGMRLRGESLGFERALVDKLEMRPQRAGTMLLMTNRDPFGGGRQQGRSAGKRRFRNL